MPKDAAAGALTSRVSMLGRKHRDGGIAVQRLRDAVDIRAVTQDHREEVAVAQHRALGAARGAARVEEPGQIVRRCRYRLEGIAVCKMGIVVRGCADDPVERLAGIR
jgi:hypothetical protein